MQRTRLILAQYDYCVLRQRTKHAFRALICWTVEFFPPAVTNPIVLIQLSHVAAVLSQPLRGLVDETSFPRLGTSGFPSSYLAANHCTIRPITRSYARVKHGRDDRHYS